MAAAGVAPPPVAKWRANALGSRRVSSGLRLRGDLLVQASGSHHLPLDNARALASHRPDRRGEAVPSRRRDHQRV